MLYRWIYFNLEWAGSSAEYRREARYRAQLYLHRQIFDFERILYTPQNLTAAKIVNDLQYYFHAGLADVLENAELPLQEARAWLRS